MIAWLVAKTGLSAIVVKLILGAALVGGLWYALELWGAKQWAKGEQQGRVGMSLELEKANKAEWAARQAELDKATAQVDADRQQVETQKADLERMRLSAQSTLRQVVAASQVGREVSNAQAITLPPDELDSALRSLSAELAAAKP